MLVKIIIGIVIVVVVFVVIVAMQPSEATITRSMTMPLPAAPIYAQVNDFHKWEAWSPWAKLDPAAKNSFEGAPSGEGAIFTWSGNKEIGEGRMTIIESKPTEMVRIKLEFMRPFPAINDTSFTFKPDGNQTKVTWTMTGKRPFMVKMVCMFMNMDKMVGGDFEKGLAQMKAAAESSGGKT
jgi:hypothetical protein